MYYEDDDRPVRRKHRRRRRRFSLIGFLIKTLVKLAVLAVIAALVLYALPVQLFMFDNGNVSASPDMPKSKINILMLGVDRFTGAQRSDTMIVASVGHSSLTLTSILRDTIVNIPGQGKMKANAAYAYGGPELTMRTLNENFGFNITKYVVVDFAALADIINAMGGVDIQLTKAEQTEINNNVSDAWDEEFYPQGYGDEARRMLDLDFSSADENGRITARLDGFQALGFARIRKLDSDFMRTSRQRRVMNACMTSLKSNWKNIPMLVDLFKVATSRIQTNMGMLELLSIAAKGITAPEIRQQRLPADGTFYDNGSSLSDIDYEKNLAVFKEFVYGQ